MRRFQTVLVLASFFLSILVQPYHMMMRRIGCSSLRSQHFHLLSNDEITELIKEREVCRRHRNYEEADRIKSLLESMEVDIKDYPFTKGGHSTWTRKFTSGDIRFSIMQLARAALTAGSAELEGIVDKTKEALRLSFHQDVKISERELQGRKSCDCAFLFALAGVVDEELFDLLINGAVHELDRIGVKASCRPVDILQMAEKLAVAGVIAPRFYQKAAEILHQKDNSKYEGSIERLQSGNYSLLDNRPLLWLWRNAAKQLKEKIKEASKVNIGQLFDNPKLPLVIDLGCGYGVSNIALAKHLQGQMSKGWLFNILGCDLSTMAVTYANGISGRWNLGRNCKFVNMDAESCLQMVSESYPGEVLLISINFPTPYHHSLVIKNDKNIDAIKGNKQLPRSFETFLVTPTLIMLTEKLFCRNVDIQGILFLQSNVEDVATTMKSIVQSSQNYGFLKGFSMLSPDTIFRNRFFLNSGAFGYLEMKSNRAMKRQQMWIQQGGERPYGKEWLSESLLPTECRSETEVECLLNGKPVHRLAFIFNN